MSAANVAITFGDSPGRGQYQGEREVCRGFGKDVRRIRNQNVSAVAGLDIDVVVTDGNVRYDAQPGSGVDDLLADAYSRGHDAVRVVHGRRQEFGRHGFIHGMNLHIAMLRNPVDHRSRDGPCNQDLRSRASPDSFRSMNSPHYL